MFVASAALAYARASDTTNLFIFLNSKTIYQCRNNRFGKAARNAHHGWIFFIKEIAWIVGELKLAAKDKILVVVQHAIVVLVTHCHGGGDRDFKNPRASFVVEQHTGKTKRFHDAIDHRIGAFALALHAYSVTAMNQFVHHRLGKAMLDLESQRVILKGRHGNGLDMRRQLALSHRLVTFSETGDQQKRNQQYRAADDVLHCDAQLKRVLIIRHPPCYTKAANAAKE